MVEGNTIYIKKWYNQIPKVYGNRIQHTPEAQVLASGSYQKHTRGSQVLASIWAMWRKKK